MKTVQVMAYIAKGLGRGVSKLDMLKLIFLADRYHLRKYARTITGDTYTAMKYGPVANASKLLIECLDDSIYARDYLTVTYNTSPSRRYEVLHATGKVDVSLLSETDCEALDQVIASSRNFGNLVNFTHRFPEWSKHAESVESGEHPAMDLVDCFESCDAEYCDIPDDLVEMSKSIYLESVC